MSFEYQGFATLGVNLNRQKYGPLDISNVFNNQNDLKYYLSKGSYTTNVSDYWKNTVPYPYAGQVIAYVTESGEGEAWVQNVQIFKLVEKVDGTFETAEIGAKVDLSAYMTADEVAAAIEAAIAEIPEPVIPEDIDTKTKVVSGDEYIKVEGDYAVNAENTFTLSIDEAKLKALIGAETTAAMEFKGAVATLPEAANKGDVYKASAIFIVPAENSAEEQGFTTNIGDSIVANGEGKWYLIPSGDDIEDTWRPVVGVDNDKSLTFAKGDVLEVTVAEDGTITYKHASVAAPQESADTSSARKYLTGITTDGFGHITGFTTASETVKDTNDTYVAGDGIEILDEEESVHSVHIKLANGEKHLQVDENGLAIDLSDYATNAEAKANNGIRYINQEEINKLNKLSLEDGEITISGSVEASQVKNLYRAIENIVTGTSQTEDLDENLEGLQVAFGIEKGAEVNKIDDVSSDFNISEDRVLALNDIAQSKVIGLTDDLTEINNNVQSLSDIINGYTDENGEVVQGLAAQVASLASDLPNTYVTVADFNSVVGNLEEMKANNINIMGDISEIKDMLEWKFMDSELQE